MKVTAEHNLAKLHPNLAKQWHPTKNGDLKPTGFSPKSHQKIWWKCEKNPEHEWQAIVSSRTNGTGCPECHRKNRGDIYHKAVLKKRGSLAENNPDLAKQWHPTKNGALKPTGVTPKSNQKVWWKCNNGHEWATTINSRTQGTGCPFCF